MCGIAGILSCSSDARVEAEPLRTMAAQLVHRGPDDEGYFVDAQARCGLAFRRLSIIDVAGGNQPLSNEDGTIHVVFNGEIYNFRELRAELEATGHRFNSNTDGEVIAHLYEDLGEACFELLSGMFAIAIWDARESTLLLARDRFGKKPLTYATHNGRLYFASEAKAILTLPDIPRELDAQSLHRYLIFQYVPAPHSIYRGFRKIPPGHYVKFHANTTPDETQYALWPQPWPSSPDDYWRQRGYEAAKQHLGEVLRRAVEKRLISDVPLGAFLSGGVDSSIIVALMRELGVSPLRTFSIGFGDRRYDETAYARQIAKKFGTEHHEHIVTPQAREVLDTLAWHYDEPFADSSAIPTYYVAKFARERVTVALTGDAGDECFAGYDRYVAAQVAARFDLLPKFVRSGLAAAAQLLPHGKAKSTSNRAYRFLSALGASDALRYLSWVNVFPPAMLRRGYQPDFAAALDQNEPLKWFEAICTADHAGLLAENNADFLSYLPYDLLTKVDIASMACSLECRSPFLDHELVEFAFSLPLEWRINGGGGKRILKDWARTLLPAEVLDRPKMGFGVPVGEWFRGELRGFVEERLLADASLSTRIFRPKWLADLLGAHLSGRENHEHRLWALLMLELWQDRWQATLDA